MRVESIYTLIMSGYPVYIEGGSGLGKTEFLEYLGREVAHPNLVVSWNSGGIDDKELLGLTFITPYLLKEDGTPVEIPFTNYALTQAAITLKGLNEGSILPPPDRANKRKQVLIIADELANASNFVKSSIQAAITSGGKWAGLDVGHPLVVAAGNPPDVSSLASPLGAGLTTRLIRVRWDFTPTDFVRFLYLVLAREQVEQIRRRVYSENGAIEKYRPLSDEEYITHLEKVYEQLENKDPLLQQALSYAKQAIKEGRPLEWPIGKMPDPEKVRLYHQKFVTLLLPYFAEGKYDNELDRVDLAEAVDSDRPIPTNRTVTWAIGAAAVLSALYDTPSHPDVREAIVGLVGEKIGSQIYNIIGNALIPNIDVLASWLTGEKDIDFDTLKKIIDDPDLLNAFSNLFSDVAYEVFAQTFTEDGVPANPLMAPIDGAAKVKSINAHNYTKGTYYLFHPRRFIFGGTEKTFTALHNFAKIAKAILAKQPVLTYRLSRALPLDYAYQLNCAVRFIMRNAEDIIQLNEKGKLAEALPWLYFIDSGRAYDETRSMMRQSAELIGDIVLVGGNDTTLKLNLTFLGSISPSVYNYLPIAAEHYETFSRILRLNGENPDNEKKAAKVLQTFFKEGNVIRLSANLLANTFQSMKEAQTILCGDSDSHALKDFSEWVDRYNEQVGLAHMLAADILRPLVDDANLRFKFLLGERSVKAQIYQKLADTYEPRILYYSNAEVPLATEGKDATSVTDKFHQRLKEAAKEMKPMLPLPMHVATNVKSVQDTTKEYLLSGVILLDEQFLAKMKSHNLWLPSKVQSSNQNFDFSLRTSGNNSAVISDTLTGLEERLGIASLLVQAGIHVMLIGEFGAGKTAWAQHLVELSMKELTPRERELLEKHNLSPVIFVPGPSLDPPELTGISYPYYDQKEKRLNVLPAAPFFFRELYQVGEINDRILKIVILDEITGMRPQSMRALAAAMPNRPGGRKVKGPVVWVATGNPPEGSDLFLNPKRIVPSALASSLPEVIRRRFVVIPIGPSQIDQRKMEMGKTLAKFLAANVDAPFESGRGFNYNTRWNMPHLPPAESIARQTLYWAHVIGQYTLNHPQQLASATGLSDSELLPFDSPATRDKLVRALGVITAANPPYNSEENIAFVMRAVVGKRAGDAIFSFWQQKQNTFPEMHEITAHIRHLAEEEIGLEEEYGRLYRGARFAKATKAARQRFEFPDDIRPRSLFEHRRM